MSTDFERQKNIQATLYTFGVTGAVILLFFLIKWSIPVNISYPPVQEVIDINLGSGDVGSGHDQPQLPGEPAPAKQTSYIPPQPVKSVAQEDSKDIDDNEKENTAPPLVKPTVVKPNATKINTENKTVKTTPKPQQVIVQAPPRPKAILGHTIGGNGNGGNGADTYKPGTNEGIAGGNGDQGRPGGNPNGKSYTGSPRNLGVRIISIPSQSFQDDFNEGGKIALDIEVDGSGKLVSASYEINGSTLPQSSKQYIIALRRAKEVKYPKVDGGFKQVLSMNFSVK
jgi:hypothetical protein